MKNLINLSVKAALNSIFLFVSISLLASYDSNPLSKQVKIIEFEGPIETVLQIIEKQGEFYFSYNPSVIDVSNIVTLASGTYEVEAILQLIFGQKVDYHVSGNHIILLPSKKEEKRITKSTSQNKKEKKPKQYEIHGTITNSETGAIISEATVFESNKLLSTLTDQQGNYSLSVSGEAQAVPITISKTAFYDTVIVVQPSADLEIDLNLRPMLPATVEVLQSDVKIESLKGEVNEVGLVQWAVPQQQISNTENLNYEISRPAQVSFIPYWGSNRKMSGNTINNLSLNVLGGYSAGTHGVEIGGLVNIDRVEMKGFQMAGIGNVTGGRVKGIQVAGFFNQNRGSTRGVQIAGFHNVTFDTMAGGQFAGFVNVLHGRMEGFQAAGFANITTQDVNGVQVAGFANLTGGDVKFAQIAGFINQGHHVGGGQIAGFGNVAEGHVGGGQLAGFFNSASGNIGGIQTAGFMNIAQDVGFLQMAGFANISTGTIKGSQAAGFINVARKIEGLQLAPFNFADSASEQGLPIGFFSYVNNGYHSFGLTATEYGIHYAQIKTGVNRFYNIFGFGIGIHELGTVYGLEYGIGNRKMYKTWLGRNWEATTSQTHLASGSQANVNMVNSLCFNLEFAPSKHISITIGPALRSQFFNTNVNAVQPIFSPYRLSNLVLGSTQTDTWIGGNLGVKVVF